MGEGAAEAAVAAFRRYARTFETLNPQAVAPFFNQPALLISPQGIVALPTAADVAGFFTPLMDGLRAQAYTTSEFPRLAGHRLGDDLALVSGVGIWKTAAGAELRRFGLTYTLVRGGGSWKIAVAAVHDPDAALP